MENWMGILKIKVQRGVNLAVRDARTSDPYVILRLGKQKLKTSVMKKNVNPEWNDLLTLSVSDPNTPIKLFVYDKDTFIDDKMGDAEFYIGQLINSTRSDQKSISDGTVVWRVQPNSQNCLGEESQILKFNGKVVQNMVLRLRNVECGEIELQLQWLDVHCSSTSKLCYV